MRISIALMVSLSFASPTPALSSEIRVEGKVDSVSIYRDRASVKRVADVETTVGAHTIVFENLPSGLYDSSVRVSARTGATVIIKGARVSSVELSESANPEEAALTGKIEKLNREIKKLDYKITARKEQLKFVEKIAGSDGKKASSSPPLYRPTVADLNKLLDMIYGRSVEAGAGVLDAQTEQESMKKELDRLTRELNKLKSQSRKSLKSVAVDFVSAGPAKGVFTLEYTTPGAYWEPVYTARTEDSDDVRVGYSAMIHQRTGEDWGNVKVALSTANPLLSPSLPDIEPWIIGAYSPMREQKTKKGDMALMAPQSMAAPAPAKEEEARTDTAEVASSGAYAFFQAPGRHTIKSGADKTRIPVVELTFKPETTYVTIPKISPYIYMRSKFVNNSDYPLLAGEAQTFVGDSLTGASQLKPAAPGQEVKLDFGADEGMKVERKLIKKERADKGIVQKRISVHYVYEIKLENFKKTERVVELKDQLPLPQNEEVRVEDVVAEPKFDKRDERNILTWDVTLKPGEKKKFRLEFTVSSPEDFYLYGLD